MVKKVHKARKSPKVTGTQVLAQTLGPDLISYNVKPENAKWVAEEMSQILNRHYQVALMRLEDHNEDE